MMDFNHSDSTSAPTSNVRIQFEAEPRCSRCGEKGVGTMCKECHEEMVQELKEAIND